MVIEWLRFQVPPELREKFIKDDEEIWTKALMKYPGYLGKEFWIDPKAQDEIVIIVHWESLEQWQSIPQSILEEVENNFTKKIGKDNYKIIESREYQIRKFPVNREF